MAVASVLLYTSPIFVTLMSAVLFRERMTVIKAIALVLAFFGCVLVTGILQREETLSLKGILLGLGSGFGYALYSIFSKYAMRKYSSETVTVYTFFVAGAASLPLGFLGADLSGLSLDGTSLLAALMLSLVCCVLPYVLYTKGLQKIEAGRASVIATCEPVVASVLGVAVFHETMTPWQGMGILLVLGAVVILSIGDRKKGKQEEGMEWKTPES